MRSTFSKHPACGKQPRFHRFLRNFQDLGDVPVGHIGEVAHHADSAVILGHGTGTGEPEYFSVVARDIRDQRRSAEHLQRMQFSIDHADGTTCNANSLYTTYGEHSWGLTAAACARGCARRGVFVPIDTGRAIRIASAAIT